MDEAEHDDLAPTSDGVPDEDELLSEVAAPSGDLAELPPPPRWQRTVTLTLMVVTLVASVLLAWSLRREAWYALAKPQPLDVGDLRSASLGTQHSNRYVRATVNLERAPAVEYARIAEPDSFRLVPVAGASSIWVEHRVPAAVEGPRFLPPRRVAGRLVRASDLGVRHRGLAAAVEQVRGEPAGKPTWLLLEGFDPSGARWCLALVVVLAAFASWNVWGIARLTRRFSEP